MIDRCIPLPRSRFDLSEGINLIYGPNGSGKSLIIEVIYNFIAGENCFFDEEDRLEEQPEGFIVMIEGDEERKLERNQTLREVYNLNIDHTEIKNLFFIRDSDLWIDDNTDFYDNLTDKIIGIKTKEIAKVKEELERKGYLTQGRSIADVVKLHKPKTQLRDAKNLTDEIKNYIAFAKENEFDVLESSIFSLEEERKKLREKSDILREVEKKEEYEGLEQDWKFAGEILNDIEELPDDESVNTHLNLCKLLINAENKNPLDEKKRIYKFIKYTNYGLLAGLIILLIITSLISAFFSTFFLYGVSISGFCFVLYLGALFYIVKLNTSISKKEKELISFNHTIKIEYKISFKTLPETEQFLKDIVTRKRSLRDSFMKSISIHEVKYKIKNLEQDKDSLEIIRRNLEEHKKEINFDLDAEYSEEEHSSIRARLGQSDSEFIQLNEKLNEHRNKISDFDKRLNNLEFEIFTGNKLNLLIINLDSLSKSLSFLDGFIDRINTNAEIAINALDIFDIIEEEESKKKAELFEDNEYLVDILKEITNGYLVDIGYVPTDDCIVVEKENGLKLDIERLSKGEQSQVLFSIRTAFASKLLGEKKGFFIVENPFLSSDNERLHLQLNFIRRIAEQGWQIIFFSSKNEILEYFQRILDEKSIFQLNRL